MLYILDEPSIGLHQRDNRKLIGTLERLRDQGNTVLVVEHDEEMIRSAGHVIDMGPGAGQHGGRVVAEGSVGRHRGRAGLGDRGVPLGAPRGAACPAARREARGWLTVHGARENNLRGIDARFPIGALTCVTGVSGSGKSTLVNEVLLKSLAGRLGRRPRRPGAHDRIEGLEHIDKVIDIDQSPIGRTPRSNPATYTGLFDHIRQLFSMTQEARARGYSPGRFSFNVKGGRCEACKGDGTITIEMHFLPDVYVPCEVCGGRRFNRETLSVRYGGRTIARGARHERRGGGRGLRRGAQDPPAPADPARRRPRLRAARPAGHDALGRRGPAREAGHRAVEGRHRPHALRARRAHHRASTSPTSRSCSRCSSGWWTRATPSW